MHSDLASLGESALRLSLAHRRTRWKRVNPLYLIVSEPLIALSPWAAALVALW